MLRAIPEASKELGVSAEHARRMVRARKWPFYRLGPKAMRLDVEEIRALSRQPAEEKHAEDLEI